MEDMSALHSQLSSIMEKLLVSAVTEIKQLVRDYCTVLRVELNRQKRDNGVLREDLRVHRPVNGSARGSQDGKMRVGY